MHDDAAAGEAMSHHILIALELFGVDLDRPLDDLAVNQLESAMGEQRRLVDMVEQALSGVPTR